ncbi:MAG: ATP-dependent dethiobiotin synthetase BioD [Burkholderiales bacterium]
MKQGYFITGTDTGVGKTLISCALLHTFAKSGKSVAGMKPVVAGCEQSQQGLIYGDVEALLAASAVAVPRNVANPHALNGADSSSYCRAAGPGADERTLRDGLSQLLALAQQGRET